MFVYNGLPRGKKSSYLARFAFEVIENHPSEKKSKLGLIKMEREHVQNCDIVNKLPT